MADKFNLEGFSVDEDNNVDFDGTLTIGSGDGAVSITDGAAQFGATTSVFINGKIFTVDLPTSDPGAEGQWWNDSGTIKISAG